MRWGLVARVSAGWHVDRVVAVTSDDLPASICSRVGGPLSACATSAFSSSVSSVLMITLASDVSSSSNFMMAPEMKFRLWLGKVVEVAVGK